MSEIQNKINQLIENRETARLGGGQKRIDAQHAKGKYTARERIQMLLDEGSFEEFDMFVTHRCYDFGMDKSHAFGDGVVTGYGTINGRLVYVFAQDFTVTAGSLSLSMSDKICKVMDMALRNGAPCIGMNDSGGARIQEGVNALAGYANIFQRNVMSSGVIPQISAIFGPCAGGAVYSPALTDFIIMKKETSNMFLTGPKVVKTVTGEDVTQEQLGGATMHTTKSGVAQFAVDTEEEGIELIRKLISLHAAEQHGGCSAGRLQRFDHAPGGFAQRHHPRQRQQTLRHGRGHPCDRGQRRVPGVGSRIRQEHHHLLRAFQRPVGRHRRQPAQVHGRRARHQRQPQGRAFHPLLRCVQHSDRDPGGRSGLPAGYDPGVRRRHHHGAKLLFAYCEATVPKVTVTLRKAYGGAYIVMSSKHIRGDINYAWPTAEIAVMGASGAVEVLYGKEVAAIESPEEKARFVAEKEKEYNDKFSNPYNAARYGYIDDVIEPRNTRFRIIRALQSLATKRLQNPAKKHSNIPL